jgi:hypothetical protein
MGAANFLCKKWGYRLSRIFWKSKLSKGILIQEWPFTEIVLYLMFFPWQNQYKCHRKWRIWKISSLRSNFKRLCQKRTAFHQTVWLCTRANIFNLNHSVNLVATFSKLPQWTWAINWTVQQNLKQFPQDPATLPWKCRILKTSTNKQLETILLNIIGRNLSVCSGISILEEMMRRKGSFYDFFINNNFFLLNIFSNSKAKD